MQRAKKVVSDSPGLVDFAIGLVNSVFNLPDGQVKFFVEFKLQKYCEINLLIKTFLWLVEMMFWPVNVSFSLPEWQAVKITFFVPCYGTKLYPMCQNSKKLKIFQISPCTQLVISAREGRDRPLGTWSIREPKEWTM